MPSSPLFMRVADDSKLKVWYLLPLPITISGSTRTHTVHVVPQLLRSCIIGNDFIQKHNLQIDGRRQIASFKRQCNQNFNRSDTELVNHNEDEYILISDERLKIPPAHTVYIRVRPNRPFLVLNKAEEEEYEITSIRATPCVANGIMSPQKNLQIQAANLSGRTLMVHVGQPIVIMTTYK